GLPDHHHSERYTARRCLPLRRHGRWPTLPRAFLLPSSELSSGFNHSRSQLDRRPAQKIIRTSMLFRWGLIKRRLYEASEYIAGPKKSNILSHCKSSRGEDLGFRLRQATGFCRLTHATFKNSRQACKIASESFAGTDRAKMRPPIMHAIVPINDASGAAARFCGGSKVRIQSIRRLTARASRSRVFLPDLTSSGPRAATGQPRSG